MLKKWHVFENYRYMSEIKLRQICNSYGFTFTGSVYKDKPNYKMSKRYDCPHCNSRFGNGIYGRKQYEDTTMTTSYEIFEDVKWMNENVGFSWTEDCICGNCGKWFSHNNGC